MRRTLGDDASGVEHDDSFPEGEYFFAAVRDIKNRDAVGFGSICGVVDDVRLRGSIERGQRFVEQQNFGIRHQCSRQRDALAFSSGDLAGFALLQMS